MLKKLFFIMDHNNNHRFIAFAVDVHSDKNVKKGDRDYDMS